SKSVFGARFKFYTARKSQNETSKEWAALVKSLSSSCQFTNEELKVLLIDVFIVFHNKGPVQDKLMEEKGSVNSEDSGSCKISFSSNILKFKFGAFHQERSRIALFFLEKSTKSTLQGAYSERINRRPTIVSYNKGAVQDRLMEEKESVNFEGGGSCKMSYSSNILKFKFGAFHQEGSRIELCFLEKSTKSTLQGAYSEQINRRLTRIGTTPPCQTDIGAILIPHHQDIQMQDLRSSEPQSR
ncbi:hypothetical protein JTB14_027192, partial [Gonioctena quinquepunctata]